MSLYVQVWGRAQKTFGFGKTPSPLYSVFVLGTQDQDKEQDCHPSSPIQSQDTRIISKVLERRGEGGFIPPKPPDGPGTWQKGVVIPR